MNPSLLTGLVWACVGASAVGYSLRLAQRPQPSTATLVPAAAPAVLDEAAAQRLFGAAALPTEEDNSAPADARFTLLGVAAAREPAQQQSQGVALIAIDNAPARALRVGQRLDGQTRLLRVTPKGVELEREGGARIKLALPERAPDAQTLAGLPGAPQPGLPLPPALTPAVPPTAEEADPSGPRRPPTRPQSM